MAPGNSVTCSAAIPPFDRTDGTQSHTGSVVASAVHPATGAAIGQVTASDLVTYTPVGVPAQLAFTGPGSFALPFGLALSAVGATLVFVSRRRSPGPPAVIPVEETNPGLRRQGP